MPHFPALQFCGRLVRVIRGVYWHQLVKLSQQVDALTARVLLLLDNTIPYDRLHSQSLSAFPVLLTFHLAFIGWTRTPQVFRDLGPRGLIPLLTLDRLKYSIQVLGTMMLLSTLLWPELGALGWTYTAVCLLRNYLVACKTGVPLCVIPIDHVNPLWILVDTKVLSLTRKLLRILGDNSFTRHNLQEP